MLLALQKAEAVKKQSFDIPAITVEKADDRIVDRLKQKGVIVLPVAQYSNYLLLNFVTHPVVDKEDLQLMQQIKKQVIWLRLDNSNFDDEAAASIAPLTSLTKLNLAHTDISDKGLQSLQQLTNLTYLNLVGTKVTMQGLMVLKNLKKLALLYLYQANIKGQDWATIKKEFPKTQVDSGGYQVPVFTSDTTLVKSNVKY